MLEHNERDEDDQWHRHSVDGDFDAYEADQQEAVDSHHFSSCHPLRIDSPNLNQLFLSLPFCCFPLVSFFSRSLVSVFVSIFILS
jgi:hypothetical protein